MLRPRRVERRRSIFVAVEGKSDHAFVRFIGMCCEEKGIHLHPDIRRADGGDSVQVVEFAVNRLSRLSGRSSYSDRLILLDQDRIEQDVRAGRDAQAMAARYNLKVILQSPNLEGLLLRLHEGHEQRRVSAQDSLGELRKVWPEYDKSLPSERYKQRFKMADLLRVANHDKHLRGLLDAFEL